MCEKIIWQPKGIYQKGKDFRIILNHEFANEMINSRLSRKDYLSLQELPMETMGVQIKEPYIFYKDTLFLKQINLRARDGKWLTLENFQGEEKSAFRNQLKYSTHNLDYRPSERDIEILLGLFDLWIEYSPIIKS